MYIYLYINTRTQKCSPVHAQTNTNTYIQARAYSLTGLHTRLLTERLCFCYIT